MIDRPPNPYQNPEASGSPPFLNPYEAPAELRASNSLPLLPPLATPLLLIGLVLITVAWLTLWADLNGRIMYGMLIICMCGGLNARVIKPHSIPWKGMVSSRGVWRLMIAFGGLVAWLNFGTLLPPVARDVVNQPVVVLIGWAISCGLLIRHWWNRRNNPPYYPDSEANG